MMSYEYVDPEREGEPHALPDVEVFFVGKEEARCLNIDILNEAGIDAVREWHWAEGWFYAFGFPGCLWDSEPNGPFGSRDEALEDAREIAGVYD